MYVTKVVDLFAKIPEQLSLYFSDFSTILNKFTSLLFFKTKEKGKRDLASRPPEA